MKNDFDFIKDKIENSGVNAPEKMDEAYVERLLTDCQPELVEVKRKRPSVRRIAAMAASFVVVAGIAVGVAVKLSHHDSLVTAVPEVDKGTGLIQFSSYNQVHAALKEISERNYRYAGVNDEEYSADSKNAVGATGAYVIEDAAPEAYTTTTNAASGSSGSHSETYRQVEGVDEADIIKTDGRYIYCVTNKYYDYGRSTSGNYVSVFTAKPGTKEPIAKIIPGQDTEATPDEATPDEEDKDIFDYSYYYRPYHSIAEIFVKDDRMVIITNEDSYDEHKVYREMTCVYVYDINDPIKASLLDSFSQSGSYNSSRMIGDILYIITTEYSASDIPLCGRGATPNEIPADCIYSVEKPDTGTFMVVSSYDTIDYTSQTQSKAVLGVAEEVYCNENNLYITATDYRYFYGVYNEAVDYEADDDSAVTYGAEDATEAGEDEPVEKTKIFKISLTDGIAFTAYGEVDGYIDSRYSLDEYNGNLRVATTVTDKDFEQKNDLYILNGNLDQIGAINGFAETESIKAVRYMGDTAYVITYERTDPLFVIDLSSPTAPKILGSVKISGFSTMLVPIGNDTVLGLGYNASEVDYTDMEVTDGFKLALFDVSDPSAPKVLDSRSYVNYNSEVMYNPRALVYNRDRGDFIVPVNYYYYDDPGDDYDEWNDEEWDSYYYSHVEQYGGVLNFRVEDGKIVETGLYRSSADSIERCVYVDDTIYMSYYADGGEIFLDSVSYD